LRLDAHQHFTSRHPPEHLKTILERNRFEGSIVVAREPGIIAHEFVKGIVRQVDYARLNEAHNLFGVLHSLDDGIPHAFVELARRGIPVDLEMRPNQLPMLARIADAAPGLRVAIDDLANPRYGEPMTDEWARGLEEAAKFPQVFCKASSLPAANHCRPYVQHALRVFGPSRLMFGSGWPSQLPERGWKETLAAFTQSIGAQPIEVREQLLGETAARFYRLSEGAA
jgi:predicted TIM-barrel fold metal-dependent hydrolase